MSRLVKQHLLGGRRGFLGSGRARKGDPARTGARASQVTVPGVRRASPDGAVHRRGRGHAEHPPRSHQDDAGTSSGRYVVASSAPSDARATPGAPRKASEVAAELRRLKEAAERARAQEGGRGSRGHRSREERGGSRRASPQEQASQQAQGEAMYAVFAQHKARESRGGRGGGRGGRGGQRDRGSRPGTGGRGHSSRSSRDYDYERRSERRADRGPDRRSGPASRGRHANRRSGHPDRRRDSGYDSGSSGHADVHDPDYDRSGFDPDYDRRATVAGRKRGEASGGGRDGRTRGDDAANGRQRGGDAATAARGRPTARGPVWGPLPPSDLAGAFNGKPPTTLVAMARRWEKQLKAALNARRAVRVARQSGSGTAVAPGGRRARGRGHLEGVGDHGDNSDEEEGHQVVAMGSLPTADAVATAIKQFRRALCAAYSAVLLKDASVARKYKLGHYLWVLYYHDIGEEKSRLKVRGPLVLCACCLAVALLCCVAHMSATCVVRSRGLPSVGQIGRRGCPWCNTFSGRCSVPHASSLSWCAGRG